MKSSILFLELILGLFHYSDKHDLTFQFPDIILYNNDTLTMDVDLWRLSPLEYYYSTKKLKSPFENVLNNTSNTRGYVAIWKIENEKLCLIDIRNRKGIGLKELFPEKVKDDQVIAEWFTGFIQLSNDKATALNYLGIDDEVMIKRWEKGDFQEEEVIVFIEFENGKIVDKRTIIGDDIRNFVFETEELRESDRVFARRYGLYLDGKRKWKKVKAIR